LTLDPQADAYVKRIFGENNYTIVDNVEKLPEQFGVSKRCAHTGR
jgi:nitric oxide reductase activation protein